MAEKGGNGLLVFYMINGLSSRSITQFRGKPFCFTLSNVLGLRPLSNQF